MRDGHWVERIRGSVELVDSWNASHCTLISRLLIPLLLHIELRVMMIVKILLFWMKMVIFCKKSASGRNSTRFASQTRLLAICGLHMWLKNLIFQLIGFQIWRVVGSWVLILGCRRIWNEILIVELSVENSRFSMTIFISILREDCTWKTKLRYWSLILDQRVLIFWIFISFSIWMLYLLIRLCIVFCNTLLIFLVLLHFFELYQKFKYVSMRCGLSKRLATSHLHIVFYKWIVIFGFACHIWLLHWRGGSFSSKFLFPTSFIIWAHIQKVS